MIMLCEFNKYVISQHFINNPKFINIELHAIKIKYKNF